jgi:hypothetical protein
MDSVLNSLVMTGIFLATAAAVGIRLGRSGKPYGVAKVVLHIILFILVLSGVIASIYKFQLIADAGQYSKLSLYVTLLALLTNVAVGIRMIVVKTTNAKMIATHKLSTSFSDRQHNIGGIRDLKAQQQSDQPSFHSSGSFGSMADFQSIAAGIFKKDRIVARPFVIPRAFHIPSASPDNDLRQPVDLAESIRPEGDPAFIGDMP